MKKVMIIAAIVKALTSRNIAASSGPPTSGEHQEMDHRFLRSGCRFDMGRTMAQPICESRQKPDRQDEIHQNEDGRICNIDRILSVILCRQSQQMSRGVGTSQQPSRSG